MSLGTRHSARGARGGGSNAFLFVFFLSVAAPSVATEETPPWEPLRTVPVLDNGRVKPLDSFARETLRAISGKAVFRGTKDLETGERRQPPGRGPDPVGLLLSILADPGAFEDVPLVLIERFDLKEKLGVPRTAQHVSARFLRDRLADREGAFASLLETARLKRAERREETLAPMERAAEELHHRFRRLEGVLTAAAPAFLPLPGREADVWLSLLDARDIAGLHPPAAPGDRAEDGADRPGMPRGLERVADVRDRTEAFLAGLRAGDDPAARAAARALAEDLRGGYAAFLASRPAGVWGTLAMLDREALYNRLGLYGKAWATYLAAFAAFLLAGVVKRRGAWWVAYALLAAGLLVHLAGFLLRFSIVGVHPGEQPRVPLSNLYEALTFCALGIALWGLVFEGVYRSAHAGLIASLCGFLALVAAGTFDFFDPTIRPVEAALRSYWMNYHVSAMLLGYAGGALSLGLSHLLLFRYLAGRGTDDTAARLDHYNYRAMQVAALFIGVGLMLGAVWAGESWGRWWGWDPKETWALVTFLVYVIALHARILGAIAALGTAILGVVAFAMVFMTFYGVNLIGKGLHSYGWFEGGWLPFWVFCGAEALLLGAVGWRWRSREAGRARARSGASDRAAAP